MSKRYGVPLYEARRAAFDEFIMRAIEQFTAYSKHIRRYLD